MTRKPQSRGTCQYCGEETAKSGMAKHLVKCSKRWETIESAKQPDEIIWHLRVQDVHRKEFWLDLEMRNSATLEKLDHYLRAIWLECCGHLSQFTVGGSAGYEISKKRKADEVFTVGAQLLHLYDFGTTSETDIQVIGLREGGATTKHPIALMARNLTPEYLCQECNQPAEYLCMECLLEGSRNENCFLCEAHIEDHSHQEYGEPIQMVNSPRLGMCGYTGPADPPY